MFRACDHAHQTSGQPPKDDEGQAAFQRLAQCDVSLLARSPDLVVTGEDLLHLFRSELVPFDMENVVIISFKAGNNHRTIA